MNRRYCNYKPVSTWTNCERMKSKRGYWLVFIPQHPKSFAGGWYYEHRLVVERRVGRILRSTETVHHISENKDDCSEENLFLVSRKEHDKAIWLTYSA